jgi:hypothetical protein
VQPKGCHGQGRRYSAGTFPRRLVLRRDGRTRTCDAQFWRLPFWPLNCAPMKLKIALQVSWGRPFAVACGGYVGLSAPLVPSSIDGHAYCVPHSLAGFYFNTGDSPFLADESTVSRTCRVRRWV